MDHDQIQKQRDFSALHPDTRRDRRSDSLGLSALDESRYILSVGVFAVAI
jgi:hypothetical protein